MSDHVLIDLARCEGYANCLIESELFDLSPGNHAVVLADEVPAGRRPEVEAAIRACPAAAIRLEQR